MTEVEWSEEGEEAPKKKGGVPKWVWIGCGGGCLLAIIAAIGLGIAGFLFVKDAANPEKQWPKLQQVLPFEERPADLTLGVGMSIPFVMEQFVLTNEPSTHVDYEKSSEDQEKSPAKESDVAPPIPAHLYTATVMHFLAGGSGDFDQMFRADPKNAPFGLGAPKEPEVGEITVQGKSVRFLRFKTLGGQGMVDQLGPGMRVDLSRPGRTLLVEFRRMGSPEPITDEEITAFFDHFQVWADGK